MISLVFRIALIVCSILAEIIRKWAGYKNYKGIVMSYILLSLSNIGSPLYVWVFSDYAISEASEEMSANYACNKFVSTTYDLGC